jgi:hypothetical protein
MAMRVVIIGPTGLEGDLKLPDDDEGELEIGFLRTDDGTVILRFGKPVFWIGFSPADARELARRLLALADEAKAE